MRRAVAAGIVTAVVGYTSAFAIVLQGLSAVGADPVQAGAGLAALCVVMGLATIVLSVRYRMPITIAWSTPGAALLAASQAPTAGWAGAIGAFVVTGVLLVVTAMVPWLARVVSAIPTSIAQAMLAGVVLPLCLAPVTAAVASPAVVVPVIVVWVAVLAWQPRWASAVAVLTAMGIAVGVLAGAGDLADLAVWPRPQWVNPQWDALDVIGIAIPLWLVTMASQNVPGVAVMASFGYRVPWRPSLLVTGAGTIMAAPFGGHAINLAAISAALSASSDAGDDPARRWRAATTAGVGYVLLGELSAAVTALVFEGPAGLLAAAAGLALVGTLGGSLAGAMAQAEGRESCVVTFLVAASGLSLAGVGAAFWALVAGLVVRWALGRGRRSAALSPAGSEAADR